VLAAAAPIPAVLIVARAGAGVTLAFLIGLSLAITNAVFPPGRRAAAIAAYFGVGYAVATPMPAISGMLAHAIGWRACFSQCRSSPQLAWRSRGGTCPKRCAPLVGWIWLAWRCLPSRC
jgi:MFS family permease